MKVLRRWVVVFLMLYLFFLFTECKKEKDERRGKSFIAKVEGALREKKEVHVSLSKEWIRSLQIELLSYEIQFGASILWKIALFSPQSPYPGREALRVWAKRISFEGNRVENGYASLQMIKPFVMFSGLFVPYLKDKEFQLRDFDAFVSQFQKLLALQKKFLSEFSQSNDGLLIGIPLGYRRTCMIEFFYHPRSLKYKKSFKVVNNVKFQLNDDIDKGKLNHITEVSRSLIRWGNNLLELSKKISGLLFFNREEFGNKFLFSSDDPKIDLEGGIQGFREFIKIIIPLSKKPLSIENLSPLAGRFIWARLSSFPCKEKNYFVYFVSPENSKLRHPFVFDVEPLEKRKFEFLAKPVLSRIRFGDLFPEEK